MSLEYLNFLFPISLFIVGVIHLIPSRILFQSNYIETLYGIQTNDQSIKLIVLHLRRAVQKILMTLPHRILFYSYNPTLL